MIFKSILEKVKNFENSYLKSQKEKILEKLIKKETSNSSSNWYIINCVIMGIVLANLFNNIFLSGMVGFWSILLSLIYIVGGSSFIFAYLKRNKTKEEVIERIINEKTIRNLNIYMNELFVGTNNCIQTQLNSKANQLTTCTNTYIDTNM